MFCFSSCSLRILFSIISAVFSLSSFKILLGSSVDAFLTFLTKNFFSHPSHLYILDQEFFRVFLINISPFFDEHLGSAY
jgi:hypothetical protein